MQQIHFVKEGLNNYMVIPCKEQLERTSYGEIVLENARIPGFMNYEIREIDGKQSLYYKLQYNTSLKHVSDNLHITKEIMEAMIASIVEVIQQTEEYLLDIQSIIWRSDAVFINVSSGQMVFTYCPHLYEESDSLQNFLVELLQYIDKSNGQAYQYFMDFYNLITSPECTMAQIEQYRIKNEKAEIEYNWDNNSSLECNTIMKDKIITEDEEGKTPKKKIERSVVATAVLATINMIVVLLLLFDIWTYQYIWVLILTLFLLFVIVLACYKGDREENPDKIMEEYLREYEKSQKEIAERKDNKDEGIETRETTVLCMETIVTEEKSKELLLKAVYPKESSDLIISKNNIVLGSLDKSCDHIIKQKGISRMHAKIIKKEDGIHNGFKRDKWNLSQ